MIIAERQFDSRSRSGRVVALFIGPIAAALLVASPLAGASQAWAATTVSTSMTFTESIGSVTSSDCTVFPGGLCGTGNVVPYGHATETIVFGACGSRCDLRTVSVATGSISIHEFASNFTCPGACGSPGFPAAFPGELMLTDVIVGGTGIFGGATGNLSGTVTGTGPESQIKLSGTITTG
jgi:hypothetical protein